ncbi:MAG TPA: OadG family protein [Syntrophorhabdaceae bacterium]|nr:OadG family protein [Syntrophorhabdaceae bacterium]
MVREALGVAGTGLLIVFLTLIILSLSVKLMSFVVKSMTKKGGK